MKSNYLIFIFATINSALGNALTVYTDVGASPWSAATLNLSNFLNKSFKTDFFTIGMCFNIFLILFFLISKKIKKENIFNIKSFLVIIFCLVFSGIVDLSLICLEFFNFTKEIYLLNVFYSLLGSTLVALSVSIFIKLDIIYLPIDEFLETLKTHIFKGNVKKASLTTFGSGLIVSIIFGLLYGKISAINYITLFNLYYMGVAISFFDKFTKNISTKENK